MLSLDDPRWSDLEHAYGRASDIPDLLRRVESDPAPRSDSRDEPWNTLWSGLCHQGDVYSASYAAVPHLVAIAARTSDPVAYSFFLLPVAIEVARCKGNGPDVPAWLARSYEAALAALPDSIAEHRHENWDRATVLSVAAALAVAKGHIRVAEALMELDDDRIGRILDEM